MDLYEYIHKFFNDQVCFTFPYKQKLIEKFTGKNGLYVLFEKGETFYEYKRIVRIGSHDGNDRLVSRLGDHFLKEKQRDSIFRKHVGRCLLNERRDPYLDAWNKPFKKLVDREKYKNIVDLDYEKQYETRISEYIHNNLSFTTIPLVTSKAERRTIEEGLISILAQSPLKISSTNWVGNWHPDDRISNGKIWNINYLGGNRLSLKDFRNLVESRYQ